MYLSIGFAGDIDFDSTYLFRMYFEEFISKLITKYNIDEYEGVLTGKLPMDGCLFPYFVERNIATAGISRELIKSLTKIEAVEKLKDQCDLVLFFGECLESDGSNFNVKILKDANNIVGSYDLSNLLYESTTTA